MFNKVGFPVLRAKRGVNLRAILVLGLSFLCFKSEIVAKNSIQPNIILLIADDHGAEDVGFTGNRDVRTPFIDHLASEGVVFTQAFSTASVCSPSRSSIYTGLYPHRNGCHQNHSEIRAGIKTMPAYLSELGYRVGLTGKVHVAPESAFPFEYIDTQKIPQFVQAKDSRPFCLVVSYTQPHEPFFNKKDGVSYRNLTPKKWMPDTPETRQLTAAYYDNVENLDNEVGSTRYWLEKFVDMENTIVIYTSDHGPGLPYGKWTLYEKALHVPLIITWKGVISGGHRIDSPVTLLDLLPTMMEWAGATSIPDLDGRSLIPLIKQKEGSASRSLFAAYTNLGVQDANVYPIRSVKNGRFKLIVNFNHSEPFTIRMTERMDDRSVICGWRVLESWKQDTSNPDFARERYRLFRNRPRVELYDLADDPYELTNRADDLEFASIKVKLMGELSLWMNTQGDALAPQL